MISFVSVLFLCTLSLGHSYKISLSTNAPVVVGGTVTFRASVFDDYGKVPGGSYQYKWRDNAIPAHSNIVEEDNTVSHWNVTYPKDLYSSGTYEVQVEIFRWTLFYWSIGSKRLYFELTPLLNGGMNMTQNNETVTENYVSSASEVTHYIHFTEPDKDFLKQKATSVITYWFVDCIYYGLTTDLSFKYNYSSNATTANIETLVVASFEPLPVPTTTLAPTTTTTTTTSTTTSTTTVKPTSPPMTTTGTKVHPSNITAAVHPHLKLGVNVSEIPILPYVCVNTSIVPPDPKKTYGYFSQKLDIKAPVSNVVVNGNNWLQHGDILNLSVSCNGSSPFTYCFQIHSGEYNITGNETCINQQQISECTLTVPRYFHSSGSYTVVIIIGNQVSKKVTPVGVNIYDVKKHAQLSVIVVPVACSAIAVILIVFGAAYYMQSRHRYTIEVANFDFAQASDMEYMTFSQRLRLALNNAFIRTHDKSLKQNENEKLEDSKSVSSVVSTATSTTDIVPSSVSHI